ncbi:MAG: sterol-binding protein, partial [Gammaproteobacteria bacterium]|nr:sterol-binding protein [Gammaproteobacteria bacterium]
DTAARKLGNLIRANRKWLRETRVNVMADISEYLRFEIEMLPDRLLVDEFNNAVDELRDDTERLQQRVDRLEKRPGQGRE